MESVRETSVVPERTTCAVVGGGPAGMVLGLLLARAGVEVTVLEKHADFLRDFRGDTVHPTTQDLLDELGLGARFAELPLSKLEKVVFEMNDERVVVADLRRLRIAHPYIAMVPQWDLLNLLAEAGRAEPGYTLRMQTEATGLIHESGRVEGVRYRTADGVTGELRADLTVATDGRWSVLRAAAGLRPKEFRVPIDAWWFRLPRQPGEDAAISLRMRPGQVASVVNREGYFQIAYMAQKGTDQQLRARGVERFRQGVAELLPSLADRLDSLVSMDDVKHLDIRVNRLPRWHVDGLLCLGDAAHAMSPIGGVGINLAIQDAVATAALLAEPLRRGAITVGQLARVRRRRLMATILLQGLQGLLHTTIVGPVVRGERLGPPKPFVALMRRVPPASFITSYLIAIGFRPEHAPAFARRATQPTRRASA